MDFLDPRKKRSYRNRLMLGYLLIALAIGLSTIILVYGAYGYSIDTKTGDVVQNGLLFVDSKPGGARIFLNGADLNDTTSSRRVLKAGEYKLELKKAGYSPWRRNFTLQEHSIARYVYPFLFPEKPLTKNIKSYSSAPGLFTQSPDRRWLLIQSTPPDGKGFVLDEYDTTNLSQKSRSLSLPTNLLTNSEQPGGSLKEVEWSTDNVHVLLRYAFNGGAEFIIVNRENPTESINVNRALKTNPTEVAMRNKKVAQLYLYDRPSGNLQLGDVNTGEVTAPLLQQVLAFKSYGNNLISYVTNTNSPTGSVTARIWDNGKSYPLYQFPAGENYLLDAAQFQGHWYYAAGSSSSERLNIYRDPLSSLKNSQKAFPLLALRNPGATIVSFSNNARFIQTQAGQNLAVYDIETLNSYHYTIPSPLSAPLRWMDGHRLVGASSGSVWVSDYDGINNRQLTASSLLNGGFFDRDYQQLFVLSPADSSGAVVLQSVDMRAGADLPKQ